MFKYSQSQEKSEIIYTHYCKSYSEKNKHIAVNCLSFGEAGSYSKKHTNRKKNVFCVHLLNSLSFSVTIIEHMCMGVYGTYASMKYSILII